MHRRVWIKQMLIAGVGTVWLPALVQAAGASPVALLYLDITAQEEELMAQLADAVLPRTDTPGAADLNLHQFVLKMMDDCYDTAAQEKLQAGLRLLEPFAVQTAGGSFSTLSSEKKLLLLRTIRDKDEAPGALKFFVDQMRRWTIRGYETSEYFLTKVKLYELVPGRFEGCKKIANV